MVLLALLYLGGACAQASGKDLPITGTGKKILGDFKGKAKAPFPQTLTRNPKRHIPLVKPVLLSPLVPMQEPDLGRHEKGEVVPLLVHVPVLPDHPVLLIAGRAPPSCKDFFPL